MQSPKPEAHDYIKCVTIIQIELEFGNFGFCGDGKTGVPGEKTSGSEDENQQQTQPTYGADSKNRAPPHWWEASHLTTAPSLLPFKNRKTFVMQQAP